MESLYDLRFKGPFTMQVKKIVLDSQKDRR